MKNNNKGFTLVELLAVTIVLIIIFMLAINAIGDRSKKAKMDGVKGSALSFFKAARDTAETMTSENNPFALGNYNVKQLDELGVKVSGTKPSAGYIYFEDNVPYCGCLSYGKYKIEYKNESYSAVTKGACNKKKSNCEQYGTKAVLEYDYTGESQSYTATENAVAKLEIWGAEGGSATEKYVGGYGAYSVGYIELETDDVLYIQVGQKGKLNGTSDSYNGGGYMTGSNGASGGGATSISTADGLLKNVDQSNVLIVAGGGGGGCFYQDAWASGKGGHAGGYIGGNGYVDGWSKGAAQGGTQTEGGRYGLSDSSSKYGNSGAYGQGANTSGYNHNTAGGGGGYYGGGSARHSGGGGGSGYIGNSNLTSKVMYCYTGCEESSVISTKTVATDCVNETPTPNCAKKGNGYAKITIYKGQSPISDDGDYDD